LALNSIDQETTDAVGSTSNSWVTGNAFLDSDPATITTGTIYPYVKSLDAYRCPMDPGQILGGMPTLRSYSLSCYLGGQDIPHVTLDDVEPVYKMSQIKRPSTTLTFIDEDDISINDGFFVYSAVINRWGDIPSWRHQNGDTLAFADGHLEYWKWQSAPLTYAYSNGGNVSNAAALQDLTRLQQTAP
jgi:hypothetical protein